MSATRVELVWDVRNSPSVSTWQRRKIEEKLANRIASDGTLAVAAQDSRSQHLNKELAVERFCELVREALIVTPPRRETRPSRSARNRRMDKKSKRGNKKKLRGKVRDW